MIPSDDLRLTSIEEKTLITALLMDGFWERWLVHGVNFGDLQPVRSSFKSMDKWTGIWTTLAQQKAKEAGDLQRQRLIKEAEYQYRISSLYYNLAQWIHSSNNDEKEKWYGMCQEILLMADNLSRTITKLVKLRIEGDYMAEGRIRIPSNPKGCIIMLLPLDSNKEEFFTYENDFLDAGFVTLSFDGPGQGGTYIYSGMRASIDNWAHFVHQIIDFADSQFPGLPIHLFGTSSGASWAIYGGSHRKVSKVAAVSPAVDTHIDLLPDYFRGRMFNVSEDYKAPLPVFGAFEKTPVLMYHGKKDVMVSEPNINRFYHSLPAAKLIMYDEEGHCCNFKLNEIRQHSLKWFGEGAL